MYKVIRITHLTLTNSSTSIAIPVFYLSSFSLKLSFGKNTNKAVVATGSKNPTNYMYL